MELSATKTFFGAVLTGFGFANDDTTLKVTGIALLVLGVGVLSLMGTCIAHNYWCHRNTSLNPHSTPVDPTVVAEKLKSYNSI